MNYLLLSFIVAYASLNLLVTKRIDRAYYLKENRRKLHKRLIWFLPFFGPILISSYWIKPDKSLEVMTKNQRKREIGGSFHESGAASTGD